MSRNFRDKPLSERVSRTLTSILRHNAEKLKLNMDGAGYVDVEEILQVASLAKLGATLAMLKDAVANCPKQRFGLKETEDGKMYIRANQGHTVKSVNEEELLRPVTLADIGTLPVVVHGTDQKAWEAIYASGGLSRMKRNHVHFGTGLPGEDGVISGMRQSASILIYLNLPKALTAGLAVFQSENGVILSPGVNQTGIVPLDFVEKVVERRTNKILYPVE